MATRPEFALTDAGYCAARRLLIRGADALQPLTLPQRALLGRAAPQQPGALLAACPAHHSTRLAALPALAAQLGLGAVFVKDESTRLGLGSFKALGGAYAVARIVHAHAQAALGQLIPPASLRDAPVRRSAAGLTFACATQGNHGRSVAAGARLFGARAVIFIPAGAPQARAQALAALGAAIMRVAGGYDEAVAAASSVAARNGWHLVADTSWNLDETIPGLVMQGYTVLMAEAAAQLAQAGGPPTHIFAQAGVGGLAAAAAAYFTDVAAGPAPCNIIVEPDSSACVFAAMQAGSPVPVAAGAASAMAMLDCRAASPAAFAVIARRARAFITLPEQAAAPAMRLLAGPQACMATSPSAAAGLAGLLALAGNTAARAALGLNASARVLVFNTEGGSVAPADDANTEGDV